jgi:hypothetical protein
MKHCRLSFLILLIGMTASFSTLAQTYRTRIQIQGDDMKPEIAEFWSENYIINKSDGLEILDRLWNKLNADQQRERKDAYYKARDYIKDAPKRGLTNQGSKSFSNYPRKVPHSRIDIELNDGAAFSDDRHIVYIRIKGADLSSNKSWEYDEEHIVTKKDALDELKNLWNGLSASQKDVREDAYRDAVSYISHAGANGIEGSNAVKEFTDSKAKKGEKIVITIDKGAAFSD